MLLSVRDLELRKIGFETSFPPQAIDLRDTGVRQVGNLHIRGRAELFSALEEIRVEGHITVTIEAECDRCLETSRRSFDRDFDLRYRPASMEQEGSEAELEEGESEIGFYEGEGVKLAEVAREQLLLWLPMHWTCHEDCRGMCPVCGTNLNQQDCGCQQQTGDARWAALKNLMPSG
jgi:uncharacterized protein